MPREHKHDICRPSAAKWLNSPIRTMFENPRRLLKPYVSPGAVVIDLGCGGGVFSAAAAKLAKPNGLIYAVDMQQEMLDMTKKYARRRQVAQFIVKHLCAPDDLNLRDLEADLVLAIHVVHESPDPDRFIDQAVEHVKPGGHFILVEPKHHATDDELGRELERAEANGLEPVQDVNSLWGRGKVFRKG